MYILYQSSNEKIGPRDCTSALPDGTISSIKISGIYEGKATNIMEVTGDDREIQLWSERNASKVRVITEAEATAIGKIISPANVIRESNDVDGTLKRYISGEFDIVNGQEWSELTYLYLHVDMVDGDGKTPIGLINNGTDYITITATFRATEDPASTVIEAINDEWRVLIRDNDGLIYDVVLVVFVDGIATMQYKTTNKPALCTMQESDLELITLGTDIYKIILINTPRFTVYRSM